MGPVTGVGTRPVLAVVRPAPETIARLHRIMAQRESLRASFEQSWSALPDADEAVLEAWAGAVLALVDVNAGPACLIAFWSASTGAERDLAACTASGLAAASVCRAAGARATLACLQILPTVMRITTGSGLHAWWHGMQRLSREAADCILPAAASTERLLVAGHFDDFIATGLKALGGDRMRRIAFFSLDDPLSRTLLARARGAPGLAELERGLATFHTALWRGRIALRPLAPGEPRQRSSISNGVVLLPAHWPDVPISSVRSLYRAAVAHAGAHLASPVPRQPLGKLKPLQLALINLVEDARIETLALRRFPGLRRLWEPFHTARADSARTAPALLARLARALFDPDFHDSEGFVTKGRALFADAAGNLEDPSLSQRIGRLLGHDLGQMRVQFSPRTYVVEPAYRDDGMLLWDMPDAPADSTDLLVEAARPAAGDGGAPTGPGEQGAGSAREAPADERGVILMTYPEWDSAAGVERPDWTTLRDTPPLLGDAVSLTAAMDNEAGLRGRIDRLVRASVIGQPIRLRRQPDGEELDLQAVIDAAVALRIGENPDPRVYRTSRVLARDLATMLVLDVSASTSARLHDGRSVLDVERLAVALLAEAMDHRHDPCALRAFASDGREDVRMIRIKEFNEDFGVPARSRLAGLKPGLSTRLGTALRHAGAELGSMRAYRRLLLVLTDGEPSDIDVTEPRDLVIDARRAVLALRADGIDTFGVLLDPAAVGSGVEIFGRANAISVGALADLPARLASLYFRLSRC